MDDIAIAAPRPVFRVWMPERTALECMGDVRQDGARMLTERLYDLGGVFELEVAWAWLSEKGSMACVELLEHTLPEINFLNSLELDRSWTPDLAFDDNGLYQCPVVKLSPPCVKHGPDADSHDHWGITEFYNTGRTKTRIVGRLVCGYWCQAVHIKAAGRQEAYWQISVWKPGAEAEPLLWQRAKCIHSAISTMEAAVFQAVAINRGIPHTTV